MPALDVNGLRRREPLGADQRTALQRPHWDLGQCGKIERGKLGDPPVGGCHHHVAKLRQARQNGMEP